MLEGIPDLATLTWPAQRRRSRLSPLHTGVRCRQSSANAAATPQVQPSSAILDLQVSSLHVCGTAIFFLRLALSNFDLLHSKNQIVGLAKTLVTVVA